MAEYVIPASTDVAILLMARTRDATGNLVGDFTDVTSVNATQALAAITDAVDEVTEALGTDLPDDKVASATRLITYLAAANIEMSYYPEQSAANNSMYDKLMKRYNDLLTHMDDDTGEEEIEAEEGDIGSPGSFGSFPRAQDWEHRRW